MQMHRVRRSAAMFVAVVAGMLSAGVGGASAAGWLAPDSVPLAVSDLGFDGQGSAVGIGIGAGPGADPAIRAAYRPLGGSWSDSVLVSGSGDSDVSAPKVAVDSHGNAVAVWSADDAESARVVRVASRPAGGAWSEPVQLSDASAAGLWPGPEVAIDEHGNATVIWTEFDETAYAVRSVTAPVGGDWNSAAAVYLSHGSEGNAVSPQLAVDSQGDATAVWIQLGSSSVMAKSRPAGGTWSTGVALSVGGIPEDPQLAVDPQGDAVAVWTSGGGGQVVQAAHRAAGHDWSAKEDLADGGSPQVAIDPQGRATAIWVASGSPGPVVQTSRHPAGGSWSEPVDLAASSDAGNLASPWVAVDRAGDVTAIWGRNNGGAWIAQASRRVTGSDSWSTAADLSVGSLTAVPAAGVDPQGHATVVWSASPSSGPWSSSSSVFDPVAPELRNLVVPTSGVVGQPVGMTVDPYDALSAVTTTWDFGDGGSASGAAVSHTYVSPGERTVTITGVDAAGNPTQTSRTIVVDPVPDQEGPGPGPGPGPGQDPDPGPGPGPGQGPGPGVPPATAPKLSGLRQSSARWRTHRVNDGARYPVGTTFRFRLDRAARVRFAFSQVVPGRRVKGRCVRSTKANSHKPRCDRDQARGSLTVAGKAGADAFAFPGKIHGRTLKPGRYRLLVTASADGKTSTAASIRFTIVR